MTRFPLVDIKNSSTKKVEVEDDIITVKQYDIGITASNPLLAEVRAKTFGMAQTPAVGSSMYTVKEMRRTDSATFRCVVTVLIGNESRFQDILDKL